jgi:hypothetical protein
MPNYYIENTSTKQVFLNDDMNIILDFRCLIHTVMTNFLIDFSCEP